MLQLLFVFLLLGISNGFRPWRQYARQRNRPVVGSLSESLSLSSPETISVNGIDCVPVTVALPRVGNITILEATAKSQETLVDWALEDHHSKLPTADPYGAVVWPASSTIARHLILSQEDLSQLSILELGAGTGLVSIAVTVAGAKGVLATDYEQIPLDLLEFAAHQFHQVTVPTAHFNVCDMQQPLPTDYDILVAADLMYEPQTGRGLAERVVQALAQNMKVVIGDSPGRAGRSAFLERLYELGIPRSAQFQNILGTSVTGERHELICGKNSLSVSMTPQELEIAVLELDPAKHSPV